jgi:hypothetical protein
MGVISPGLWEASRRPFLTFSLRFLGFVSQPLFFQFLAIPIAFGACEAALPYLIRRTDVLSDCAKSAGKHRFSHSE